MGFAPLAALPLASAQLVFTTTGTSAGVATVSGVGASISPMVGTSAGVATVSGASAFSAIHPMVGVSAGRATVVAGGQRIMAMVGTAAGYATVQGYVYGTQKDQAPGAFVFDTDTPSSFTFERDETPDPFVLN